MELTTTGILNSIFSALVVIGYLIVSLEIILKYKKYKKRIFLLTGFAWFGISEPWWPSLISFLMILFTGTGLPLALYLILNNAFIPIFLSCWLLSIGEMTLYDKRKTIVIIYIILAIILETVMFYYLITDISMVGELLTPVDIDFGPITVIYWIINLSIFMISGFLFTINTLKLEEPVNKLRGKFLLIAFLLFLFGAIMEIIITLPINRIAVLMSAIIFYIGFTMPENIKNHFLKNKAESI
jgi:hypothetical protein